MQWGPLKKLTHPDSHSSVLGRPGTSSQGHNGQPGQKFGNIISLPVLSAVLLVAQNLLAPSLQRTDLEDVFCGLGCDDKAWLGSCEVGRGSGLQAVEEETGRVDLSCDCVVKDYSSDSSAKIFYRPQRGGSHTPCSQRIKTIQTKMFVKYV